MKKWKSIAAGLLAAVCLVTSRGSLTALADTHRVYNYDVETMRTNQEVEDMLEYATSWVGKISYASSQNNTDPHNHRFEELRDGGQTDCSWFVYHVLFRYGLLDHFVHSYEWGNSPSKYPGGKNIGTDLDDAVAGDILCTGKGTKSQNSHVMIYLGDNQVVECASGKGGVVISKAPSHIRQIVHFDVIPRYEMPKGVDTE